ncbi:MAG: ribosome small subunit-dependent GTPase A [Gammaproteobacteria bacterium CG11_big_fil_rev_8_21_14_0_20_46_22]|nr:MAG: ribosome small subunit-dependent GTPase A [Gammaproteobacteria bacterium CG12_big_fil_rev_8_21_14_0_65_46_12]PIR10980.1 MAG: ribosome small subunit-dependent GTPase A [Gammaproteobacteria bacterium CG11_big_fil_rev_8_21_14_0_20_46_22]
MTKRRLTGQQQARIRANQDAELLSYDAKAIVLKRYRDEALVWLEQGEEVTASIRRTLDHLVPGDEVALSKDKGWVVTARFPRKTVLSRDSRLGKTKWIAANITQMIIVLAVVPETSASLIDNYLLAAANLGVKPILLVNKVDLAESLEAGLEPYKLYQDLGFELYVCSVNQPETLVALKQALLDETSIFVGQSGVGKSSLLQTLLPHKALEVGEISEKQQLGRHTTSLSEYFLLPEGGGVIDSPGVREFVLNEFSASDLFTAFPELMRTGSCQFRNCQHEAEPGCALTGLVKGGLMSAERFEHFMTLFKRASR